MDAPPIMYMPMAGFYLGGGSSRGARGDGPSTTTDPAPAMDAALVRFQALTSRFGRELAAASTSEAADTGARANGAAATAPAAAAAAAAPAAKATGGKRKSPKRSASTGTLSTADGTAVASDGAGGSGGGAAPQSQLSLDSEPEFIAFAGLTADDDADASAAAAALGSRQQTPAAASAGAGGSAAGADAQDQGGQGPHWMAYCSSIRSPLLRLHQEIVSLTELLAPTPLEVSDRERAVAAVRSAVHSIWPDASVEVFGSFATGLYVPTSDVDLVVLNTQSDIQRGLKALANKLSMERIAQGVQVLAKARVPIIKFETVDYGNLAFDISFDVPNGPQAAVLVKDFIGEWPMLRPLVLVLKLFLQQRELNEVYTGGIGSYALITLLIAFLQLHNSRRPAKGAQKKGRVKPPASPLEPCLGVLLIDFFRLYGRVINTRTTGVSATGGGHYFNKEDKDGSGTSWLTEGREYMLSVEDPKDATNDICRSSFNIMRVRSSFDFAYQQLAAPCARHESLLARILRLGPILVTRQRPINPSAMYARLPPADTDTAQRAGAPGTAHKRARSPSVGDNGGGGGVVGRGGGGGSSSGVEEGDDDEDEGEEEEQEESEDEEEAEEEAGGGQHKRRRANTPRGGQLGGVRAAARRARSQRDGGGGAGSGGGGQRGGGWGGRGGGGEGGKRRRGGDDSSGGSRHIRF